MRLSDLREMAVKAASPLIITKRQWESIAGNLYSSALIQNTGQNEALYNEHGIFSLRRNNQIVAIAETSEKTIGKNKYLEVEKIYVDPDKKRTGAATSLMFALSLSVEQDIIVGGAIFPEGAELINALHKNSDGRLQLIDGKTGEIKDFNEQDFFKSKHAYALFHGGHIDMSQKLKMLEDHMWYCFDLREMFINAP